MNRHVQGVAMARPQLLKKPRVNELSVGSGNQLG
jgi:hypothetical protein